MMCIDTGKIGRLAPRSLDWVKPLGAPEAQQTNVASPGVGDEQCSGT